MVSQNQKILFQTEYINYAWGYQHQGFIIDNNGNVLTYNLPVKWNFPHNDSILTAEQVDENLSACVPSGIRIPPSELQKYINYIDNISLSKVSRPVSVGADMGSMAYYCFRFSESTNSYKASIIKMEGDIEYENFNFYSKRVITWLKGINPFQIK
jgi:hypothetical protein